jgi:putative nucleotidyltransferase with HDIG domain
MEIAKKIKDASHITNEKKVNFLKHTNEVILEQFFLNELNDDVFDIAKSAVETTVGVFLEMPDLGALLESLNSHSDQLYAHCVGVSFYSSMIARFMDWDNPRTLYKVSMGGLFHDIGKKELDKELLAKSRRNMSAQEVKLYQSHPTRGMEILSGIRSMPSDVLQIISHHHENCIGSGWPAGLRKNHIHPLARVVSVADEFCHLVLKTPESDPVPVPEALEKLCAVRHQEFDPIVLDALLKMFKAEALKKIKTKPV